MSFRGGIARSGAEGGGRSATVRAALTFPTRFLLWVLSEPRPQGREAHITYYAHRVGERKAA